MGVSLVTVSAVAFVVAVITDSLMMSSSSTTSAFRVGGAGAIRTDITVTATTRTITMDTAGTVTKMTPGYAYPMAVDQGICGVCEAVTSARHGVWDSPCCSRVSIRSRTASR